MTAALWNETKEHTVTVGKRSCAIVLKHIGAGSPPRMFLFQKLMDAWRSKHAKACKDARLQLLAEFGNADAVMQELLGTSAPTEIIEKPTLEKAINVFLDRQPEWLDAFGAHVQEMIVEGTVGGSKTLDDLYAAGGDAMLMKARHDILEFNTLDPDQGEG